MLVRITKRAGERVGSGLMKANVEKGPAGSTTVKTAGSDGLADGNSLGLSRITVDNSVEFTYEELATTTNDQHYILHTFHICQS
ncbi:hypothetical protein BC332_15153 [Capsicum chinense]|nr:hypothetical protein BC332_15153 [Capsicum chinense]